MGFLFLVSNELGVAYTIFFSLSFIWKKGLNLLTLFKPKHRPRICPTYASLLALPVRKGKTPQTNVVFHWVPYFEECLPGVFEL